jgi:hypothetical protein
LTDSGALGAFGRLVRTSDSAYPENRIGDRTRAHQPLEGDQFGARSPAGEVRIDDRRRRAHHLELFLSGGCSMTMWNMKRSSCASAAG